MIIQVCDWMRGNLLERTRFKKDEVIEGTKEDVWKISAEIFATGLNVMVQHVGFPAPEEPESHPKKFKAGRMKPVLDHVRIWVDTQRFQKR